MTAVTRLFRHVTRPYCGVDDNTVHALDPTGPGPTTTSPCGTPAATLAVPTTDGSHSTVAWPPLTSHLRKLGYRRCRQCMRLRPGRPHPLPLATPETS